MHIPDSYANVISDEPPMLKYALAASQSLLTFLNLFIDYVQVRNEDDIENHHIQYLWSSQSDISARLCVDSSKSSQGE